eukprot:2599316-Alexandrium_andersonii.AAC.1
MSAASSAAKACRWSTSFPLRHAALRIPRGWFRRRSGMAARSSTSEDRCARTTGSTPRQPATPAQAWRMAR